jgi:chromosome segregation ATPase
LYKKEKSSSEYCLRENDQLKSQNEHLLNELARLTQLETRDRTRLTEQNDLRRQYDDILNQYNKLKEEYHENQIAYDNDIKQLNNENLQFRLDYEQLHAANDLLRDEKNQMKESHETILKKRLDEIKYLQIENRDLQSLRQRYNEDRETFQAIDLRKTQLENDLLTMQAVEDRCQDLQITVERLQTELQLSVSPTYTINTYIIQKKKVLKGWRMRVRRIRERNKDHVSGIEKESLVGCPPHSLLAKRRRPTCS